jgi:hypothetical protein
MDADKRGLKLHAEISEIFRRGFSYLRKSAFIRGKSSLSLKNLEPATPTKVLDEIQPRVS